MLEFLHVDDMAESSLNVLGLDKEIRLAHTELIWSYIDVGTVIDVTIEEIGFNGE